MSCCDVRIRIVTKTPKNWDRVQAWHDYSVENGCGALIDGNLELAPGLFVDEENIPILLDIFREDMQGDCIIIADVTNSSVDPFTFCCYYLGDKIVSLMMPPEKANMCHKIDINNVKEWLKYGDFMLTTKELQVLNSYKLD